ncbi:T-lymphocyte surface antigen Ly-9-like isoform X2 [Coregonus clupeaformis]|uniref:T-lymphocyte surface antigen Ly-9-like isoform X2 n=1 Tax=Coregonus clupeaformis TaxID=59861 RepID=UPI001E1C611E|nr:T-lymphocyte surface antigen Ly-9-like isoform X2 [Coregonus clupeaformis]
MLQNYHHQTVTDPEHTHSSSSNSQDEQRSYQSEIDEGDVQPEETDTQHLTEMSGGPLSCFSKQGILLLSILHYGIWAEVTKEKYGLKGGSVCLPVEEPPEELASQSWKVNSTIIVADKMVSPKYMEKVEYNPVNHSLCIKNLSEKDRGTYIATYERNWEESTTTYILTVQAPISKMVIQTDIKLLANQSCSVWLLCNVSVCSNLSYTWERGNETYRDDQQIHFSLSPADGDISVTCTASNLVSEKSASTTVKCSNDTTTPGRVWYSICIGVSVVLILNVAVAVYYCRGRRNTDKRDCG